MATPKQSRYIVYLIENHQDKHIKNIFAHQPKNSDRHPDTRADYRRMIFAESLEQLNEQEVKFVISCLTGEYKTKYSYNQLMRLLFEFGLVPPMPHPETGVSYDDNI